MTLRLFFTTFACLSATLFACAKPTNKEKIDKVRYEITYHTKSIIDTTKVDSLGNFIYNEEDMRLDVGEQVSFFYSYSNALYEQQRIEMMNKGNFSVPNMRGGSIYWKLFKNFPTGKTTYVDNVFRDGFRVVEPIEQPQWELISDSTARILGYDCQMARCNYKGRQWFAWFTTDIPLDNGPWKLCGLPGLILRAYDAKQQYIFNCVGMKQAKEDENITYSSDFDKYAASTMKEFVEYKTKATPQDVFVGTNVKFEMADEDMAEWLKFMAKPMPSNTLEVY